MKNLFVKLALWLLKICGSSALAVPADIHANDLIAFARKLTDRLDAESAPGTSGEYKRDRVYEQLVNTFPEVRPKHLHLAILLARGL